MNSTGSLRRVWSIVRRLATESDPTTTSLGGSFHVPAPEVHKPKVSPLTELGTKEDTPQETETQEVVTSLGKQQSEEQAEEKVITWLGEKTEEAKEVRAEMERQMKERIRQEARKAAMKPVGQLPFDLIPKFINIHKPAKLKSPLPFTEALQGVLDEASKEYDDTVRIAIHLSVDPRKSNQFVRGLTVLPHGTGKAPRIAVFAEGLQAQQAREAGVELVGGPELVQEVLETQGGIITQIDRCIATPAMMATGMAKTLGRILGPRGLMPNPKMGTLTDNVTEAIHQLRQGQIEFRVDRFGVLNSPLGKVSFGLQKLLQNTAVYGNDILQSRPEMFQQKPITDFMLHVTLSSTKGRGFPVMVPSLVETIQTNTSL